jgi:uncharacterized protein YkwD
VKLVSTWFRAMRFALAGTFLLLAGCTATSDLPSSTPVAGIQVQGIQQGSRVCKLPANSDALVARVLELVNSERQQRGLHALTLNPVLSKLAEDYCCEMIDNGFFSHDDPRTGSGPGQRAIEAGYIFLAMGENLAGGQASPEQVMNEWMNSPGHRDNILAAQWEEVGIGVRTGGDYGVYWVQEFGNPP